MATTDYKFEGWVGKDPSAAEGNMVWTEFTPKKWEETDIDIRVTHAGVCGSDLHVLRSGWGPTDYPQVVGHEIVGEVVRVGTQTEGNFKVGDTVAVGAQAESCLERNGPCDACHKHRENYCPTQTGTYAGLLSNGDKSFGGYALYHRTTSHFVFKIPEGLDPDLVAPMMCAGATVYDPIKQYGVGPGKKVGVVGIGGLGHFAVLFAKAKGAEVVGISRKSNKKEDTLKLGADAFIATEEEADWVAKNTGSLDLIISTSSNAKMPVSAYITLLKTGGTLVQLGAPEDEISFNGGALIFGNKSISSSLISDPDTIREMLQLAADKQIKPWIETRPMSEANQTLVDMEAGKARFRYVLKN